MAVYIRNRVSECYIVPSRLFVLGGTEIYHQKGSHRGIAMKHVAFADDLGGAGELFELRRWWDNILSCGHRLGYNPNTAKSWLVV